jgi:hypothetical protein
MRTLKIDYDCNTSKVTQYINNKKRILIDRAQKNGLYENFGQNEVRQLRDKFINCSDYSCYMNSKRDMIQRFSDWCATFDLTKLRSLK